MNAHSCDFSSFQTNIKGGVGSRFTANDEKNKKENLDFFSEVLIAQRI